MSQMGCSITAGVIQKIQKKFFPHDRAALLQQFHIASLPVYRRKCIFYFFRKILVINRFFNVITHTEADGLFCVFKFIIGADQYDFHQRIHGKSDAAH